MVKFQRYALTPLATLLLIGLVELASRYDWYTPSLALPVGALAIGSLWGGLYGNLISAIFISAYAFVASDYDFGRAIQVVVVSFPIAIASGIAMRKKRRAVEAEYEARREAEINRRKAELVDAVNGNIRLLELAHKLTSDLVDGWKHIADEAKYDLAIKVRRTLADLRLLVEGWHQMAQERGFVMGDEGPS